jgi:DNA-binding transcriptional LysR family regulator
MTMQPLSVPGVNAKDLHALVAIAHFGSLVGASAFLQTSQSALSRAITRIEKMVGVRLFTRTTRRIELTPAGREFVAVSERVLNDLQIVLGGLGDVAQEQRGQVIISTFPIFVQQTLPSLVRSFRDRRPQVDVHLRAGCNSEVIDDVIGGLADFGITYGDSLPDNVERVDLRRESLHVILPREHLLAESASPIRLAQLRDVPLVSPPRESYTRRLVEGAAATAGFSLRHSVHVPGFPEIIAHVRAGVGAGIVPSGALPKPLPAEIRARLLSAPALVIPISMFRLAGRQLSPAASSFWSLVVNQLKGHQVARVVDMRRARSRKG